MPLTSLAYDGHVATLTLDPPEDGYDRAFVEALTDACGEVSGRTSDVRSLVIVSAGALGSGWATAALAEERPTGGPHLGAGFDALAAVPQPTVIAIHGEAHSAGLELALAADIRLAAEGSTFAMPDTALGTVPLGGGTQRLPRAIGRAQALRLLLTGEVIGAEEARRIGLVSAVVAEGEVAAAARSIADQIATRGPIATRMVKEAIHRGAEMNLQQALRYELDLSILLQSTADRAEGVRAFAAKQPPTFIGE
jgi:enoyl-CoA hydratase/carnithine racemase